LAFTFDGMPDTNLSLLSGASRAVRAGVLVWSVAVAGDAAAQSAFVEGGFAREIKRFSNEGGRSAFDGTVSSLWIGAAGYFGSRWSVGVEADFGGESTFSETVSVTVAGRPTAITTTYTSRRRSVSALAGVHSASGKLVRVSCYGGLSFVGFRREISSDAPPVVLEDPAPLSVLDERRTGAIAGIDVAFHVTRNLAIVPALRAQGLSLSGDLSGFSIRPSIGARVVF
jgi:hypothetical protein